MGSVREGGVRVISPNEIKDYEYDYIVVGALYSFNKIKERLVNEYGCDENRIIPLLKENSHYYYNGYIDINTYDVEKIFLCDNQIIQRGIDKHNYYTDCCLKYKARNNIRDAHDNNEMKIIAHALGGYVRGEKNEYTNSLEALDYSIKSGFDIFEVDVWGIASKKEYAQIEEVSSEEDYEKIDMICGSRIKMQYPCDINYSYAFVSDLIKMLEEDPAKCLIIDLKWHTLKDYKDMLYQLDNIINYCVDKNKVSDIKKQIVIEVFNEETIKIAKQNDWNMYLTDYRDISGLWFLKSAYLCMSYGISTVMIDANVYKSHIKYIGIFKDLAIDIVVYTVDDIDDFAFFRSQKVYGCLTNFLLP